MKKVLVLAVALTMVLSAVAFAGNNPAAKVGIHVRPHNAKLGCNVTITGCEEVVTTEPGYDVDAFSVFYDLAEFLGVEYGMCWPAWTYSAAFTSCSDLVIGSVVWSGDGAAHTWTACQSSPVAVAGYIWLYADAPGFICPCPNPETGLISVLDCAEGLDSPIGIFCAGVYGELGDDPCEPVVATEASTWGGIKGMFE